MRVAGVLLVVFLAAAAFGAEAKGPSAAEIKKITDAMPKKPAAKPRTPRPKLLVFSRSYVYNHSAIPFGKKALEIMASTTGAFDVVISDDLVHFEPPNLRKFDAVFFNNTNREVFLPGAFDKLSSDEKARALEVDRRLKKSLTEYLAGGGGLGLLHAGSATFREWPEFGNILGARFRNHPWYAGTTVTFVVEEPDHPIATAFGGKSFVVSDEVYQFTEPYSRERVRVLLSIDTEKTDMTLKEIERTDGDFAISWIKKYGKGRVFYVALGHEHHLYWNAKYLDHLLRGIQFAVGDLKADATPSAKKKARGK